MLRFNPQVLNSCGRYYGPNFPGDVFPSTFQESKNHIFLLLVLFLFLPAAAAASPINSVNTRAHCVYCCCGQSEAKPVETVGFTCSLQHVSELLLPLSQRGMWAAKQQSHDASCCLRLFYPLVTQGHLLWPQVSLLVSRLVEVIA